MQTISLHGKVDKDGILRLEMPIHTRGEEVDVIVTVQPSPTHYLKDLVGAIDDETFVEPEELPFEEREPLS